LVPITRFKLDERESPLTAFFLRLTGRDTPPTEQVAGGGLRFYSTTIPPTAYLGLVSCSFG